MLRKTMISGHCVGSLTNLLRITRPLLILFTLIFYFGKPLQASNISIYGTPQSDSGRNALKQYDTVFIYAAFPVPDSMPPCGSINKSIYPSQNHDDYLHEERFSSLYHVVIFDHIVTRKMLNIFLPTLNDSSANLCGVRLFLENPDTHQVVVFSDIFNWMDDHGHQIFNTNRELSNLWGYSGSTVVFPVKMIHVPTGTDYTFGHQGLSLHFENMQPEGK